MIRLLIILIGLTQLSACIALPTPFPSAFRDSKIEFITPGVTTRAEIEAAFDNSDYLVEYRLNGRLGVYGDSRPAVFVAALVDNGGADTLDIDDFLLVDYDEHGVVVDFEVIKGISDCGKSGRCVRGGFRDLDRPNPDNLRVKASAEEDMAAKRFEPDAKSCQVYAWVRPSMMCGLSSVSASQLSQADSSGGTALMRGDYLHWQFPVDDSGVATIAMNGVRPDIERTAFALECGSGDLHYIEVERQCGKLMSTQAILTMHEVEPEIAQAEVLKRKLLLH